MKIKHKDTEDVICPHCGEIYDDDIGYGTEPLYCEVCHKPFEANERIKVTYSTEPMYIGSCTECGRENVLLEKKMICEECDCRSYEELLNKLKNKERG